MINYNFGKLKDMALDVQARMSQWEISKPANSTDWTATKGEITLTSDMLPDLLQQMAQAS
jgi:hypothetical protein